MFASRCQRNITGALVEGIQIEMKAKKKAKATGASRNGTKMVGQRGFEPPTTPTPRECATSLRYSPNGG